MIIYCAYMYSTESIVGTSYHVDTKDQDFLMSVELWCTSLLRLSQCASVMVSKPATFLCLWSARIKDMWHHTQLILLTCFL